LRWSASRAESLDTALRGEDKKLLRNVQQRRNALEHYEANLELDEVNRLVGELVDFLERFLHEQLGESLFKHVSGVEGRKIAELAKVAERLRTHRRAEWSARAARYQQLPDEKLEELAEQGDYHPEHNPDAMTCSIRARAAVRRPSRMIPTTTAATASDTSRTNTHAMIDCPRVRVPGLTVPIKGCGSAPTSA
jgi:hypothetical protein